MFKRDDIIRMAREHFADPDGSLAVLTPELTSFFRAAYAAGAAAEREACAKVCEKRAITGECYVEGSAEADGCAAAIRARGNA